MADENSKSWLSKLNPKTWLANHDKADQINEAGFDGGFDGVTVSMLLGSSKRSARTRQQIYEKWHYMVGDPIISTALRLHVTSALGGHETSGDVVFIEAAPGVKKGQASRIVDELQADLAPLFNQIAYPVAFNGAAFGDAYGRPYCKDKVGLVSITVDEMMYPPLVQPYEQGNKTVGYVIAAGNKFSERLTIKQCTRMKMPRLLYLPQMRAIEKSLRTALLEDDIDKAPVLPSLVGGSFLDAAEESYDNLQAALIGLVGQRMMESVQESMVSVNMAGATEQQKTNLAKTLTDMLKASKKRADDAVKNNRPLLERIFHFIPTNGEKQLTTISDFKSGSAQTITTDDVMFHAKMLAGALGIDLAMLGFSELLSGGLGDGGFFRMSAQAAERSRIIRTALAKFFDDLVDLHTLHKYGFVFEDGDRPYRINFYGSISALEAEKMATRERQANSGAALVQTLDQLKNLNMKPVAITFILSKLFGLDESDAEMLAKALDEAKPPEGEGDSGGFGGGKPSFGMQDQEDQ